MDMQQEVGWLTPLEKAEQKQKYPPCAECPKSKRIGKILYCSVDGRIIMPQFEDICCCKGKKLKGKNQ